MAKRKLNVSVPGESPVSQETADLAEDTTTETTAEKTTEETGETAPDAVDFELGKQQALAGETELATSGEAAAAEVVQDPKDLLVTELRKEVARRDAALLNAGITLPSYNEVKENELPDASDIDPKKIKGNVLTKQGWVLPDLG